MWKQVQTYGLLAENAKSKCAIYFYHYQTTGYIIYISIVAMKHGIGTYILS